MRDAFGNRPQQPDAALLSLAGDALERTRRLPGPVTWIPLERIERKHSTLFYYRATSGPQSVLAYYKVDYIGLDTAPDWRKRRIRETQQVMEVEALLASRLSREFKRVGCSFDEPLALDREKLAGVRLAVSGRPLGRALNWSVPHRRRQARQVFRTVGEALRVVHFTGQSEPVPPSAPSALGFVNRSLERVGDAITQEQRRRVSCYLDELERNGFDRRLTWAHNDMSASNVLTRSGQVSLIDFSWAPSLPFSDVVQLQFRMECERPRSRAWTAQLLKQLLTGHGALSDPELYRLALLERALRVARKDDPERSRWGRRIVEQLHRGL